MSDSVSPRSLPERPHLRLVQDDAIAIVLVCAAADETTMTDAMTALAVPGARLLAGIECSVDEMRTAVTTRAKPTLFVVCRSAQLDASASRRAVECFGARRVANHRLLVVGFDPAKREGWMKAVRRAYGAMQQSQAIVAGFGQVEGLVDCGDRDFVRGETQSERSTPTPFALPRTQLVMIAKPDAGGGDEDPQSWWRDVVGPIPAHVRSAVDGRPKLAVVDEKITQDDGPATTSDTMLVREAARAAHSESAGMVVPPSRVARAFAVAVVIAVVLGFAIAPVFGVSRGRGIEAPVIELAGAVVDSIAIDDDVVLPGAAAMAMVPLAAGVERAIVPPAAAIDPLEAAVAKGRIARVDDLYVVVVSAAAVDGYAAASRCRARSIDGVRGFRLPSIDELRGLRRAGIGSGEAVLWSATPVTTARGSSWVLGPRGVSAAADKHDGRAQVICVRAR